VVQVLRSHVLIAHVQAQARRACRGGVLNEPASERSAEPSAPSFRRNGDDELGHVSRDEAVAVILLREQPVPGRPDSLTLVVLQSLSDEAHIAATSPEVVDVRVGPVQGEVLPEGGL
jgi:hypothetical protein